MAAAAQAERVIEKNAAEEQDEEVSKSTIVSARACYCLL